MSKLGLFFALVTAVVGTALADDETASGELASWHHSDARQAIVEFVERTTEPGSPDYLPAPQRIAVFDNDGTLWAEQPVYFQLLFAIDRARELVEADPELKNGAVLKAAAEGDLAAVAAGGHEALFELLAATHGGTTTEDFRRLVEDWLVSAKHPQKQRPYTELVYQPMLELLSYLRDKGFRTYIVSGGGVAFLRAWSEERYGIPPEQVIGSRLRLAYEEGESPVLRREPTVAHVNDGPGKPVAIEQIIGRRPVIAVGNSDGDFEMLRWTTTGTGPRLGVLIHHTDDRREWAYDRESSVGRLDRGLDKAAANDWIVVDMKNDWRRVFPE